MKKRRIGFLVLFLLFTLPLAAYSGPASDALKERVNEVLNVLRNPALKGEAGKKAKKQEISSVSQEMFDFAELSKRSLGQNWSKLSPEQQKEFSELYKSLLEDTYADKITTYTDEKLIFGKEIPLSDKTVEVQTTVVTKTSNIPIHYRLIEENGRWKVYDVVIEGVSLISNYRSQFREILATKTPEALLETLRKKVGKIG
jgi:phospholipid transport system substrate-binding protein